MERISMQMLEDAHITSAVLQRYTMDTVSIDYLREMIIQEINYRCLMNNLPVDVYNAVACDKSVDTTGTDDVMKKVDMVLDHTASNNLDLIQSGRDSRSDMLAVNLIHGYCIRHDNLGKYSSTDIAIMLSRIAVHAEVDGIFASHKFPGDIVSRNIEAVHVKVTPISGRIYLYVNTKCRDCFIVSADLYLELFDSKETYFRYICDVLNIVMTQDIKEYGIAFVEDRIQ